MQILFQDYLTEKNPKVLVFSGKTDSQDNIQERKPAFSQFYHSLKQTLLPYLVSIYLPESSSLGLLCVLRLDVVSDELLVLHGVASRRSRGLQQSQRGSVSLRRVLNQQNR